MATKGKLPEPVEFDLCDRSRLTLHPYWLHPDGGRIGIELERFGRTLTGMTTIDGARCMARALDAMADAVEAARAPDTPKEKATR